MPQVNLKYGAEKIRFDLPDQVKRFSIKEPEKKISPSEFADKLRQELARIKPDVSNPAIVAADKTRLCGYPEYLPVLVQTLEEYGADAADISLFIAYGTHPRQSDEESLAAYGDAFKTYRFVHHDCSDDRLFIQKGKTSRGTPVMIRKDISEASFLITFGAISHHYFAGYGGGRKLIFPGLGFRNAIYRNHGLFLDKKADTLAPFCQPGILDGNPLAEDLAEYETFCPADIAIHGILNARGEVCDLRVGSGVEHFRKSCKVHGRNCEIADDRQYDLVLASCGGYPKDINFIQCHKAVHNGAKFVRDGGELIMLAQCRDGVGSQTFLPWFEMNDQKLAFERLSEQYQGNGGTALSMMSKTARIQIRMVTELSDEVAALIGVQKIQMEQVKKKTAAFRGTLAVIPNASLAVKTG